MIGRKPIDSVESFALVIEQTDMKASDHSNKTQPRVLCDHCIKPQYTREICWKLHGKTCEWEKF